MPAPIAERRIMPKTPITQAENPVNPIRAADSPFEPIKVEKHAPDFPIRDFTVKAPEKGQIRL